jgi:hypothetical protein
MKPSTIAFLLYGEMNSERNAFTEEKYRDLAQAFVAKGFQIQTVLYNDPFRETLYGELLRFDAVLVWVNPIEQGHDRSKLDTLLRALSHQGCLVSAHPEVILQMGTKEVLYSTQDIGWGGPTRIYRSYEDFVAHFAESFRPSGVKVLKQYRGNGSNGVYKVSTGSSDQEVIVVHAKNSPEAKAYGWRDFYETFKPYFSNQGLLIEQEWNPHLANGIVRCYLSGQTVVGFGYQEINALYERPDQDSVIWVPPSKRYYFTQHCGLFRDLKQIMEDSWVPRMQKKLDIAPERMPIIWDADFFINQPDGDAAAGKYTLCEINVSCVSPFPPSAIPFIVEAVSQRILTGKHSNHPA